MYIRKKRYHIMGLYWFAIWIHKNNNINEFTSSGGKVSV